MVTRTTTQDYEQSSEAGRERNVPIPWARLTDATPTLGDPFQATGLVAGATFCGTVINPGTAADPVIIGYTADGAIFRHNVRNVLTWVGGPAEATWGPINLGDPVFYDAEEDTANGVKLSTSPLTSTAAANTLFGHIVLMQDEDASDFPKGAALVGSTHVCAVMQV